MGNIYYSRQTWQRAIRGLQTCLSNIAIEYNLQKESKSDENLVKAIDEIGAQLTQVEQVMKEMLPIF